MTVQRDEQRQSAQQPVDTLLRLVQVEIPQDQARLKALKEVDPARLLVELHATVMEYLKETLRHVIDIRDWSYQSMNAISDHLEATDERLDVVESLGNESTLLPEDAEVLAKVAVGCKYIAQNLLTGPFPIGERDEEGKAKLAELIALCEQGERIIQSSVLIPDDGEDDDDGEDGDEDGDDGEDN